MITELTLDQREVVRVSALMAELPTAVFVFGSNRAGIHGGGAALVAWRTYGARWTIGEGLSGRAYGIPTKDDHIESLALDQVADHVARFLLFAANHLEWTFVVTRIGCGLAGFTDEQIAPLFRDAPANCELPEGWR